jgi:DNA-binding transcriptional MerR regulator
MDASNLFPLEELCARVSLALSAGYAGTGSERSRDVPDKRTARYYTTLGLLDRPAAMRGRTALYSRKHLLQLVAIKRLQAKGLSLHEVQTELLGMSARQLERIAQLPARSDQETEAPIISVASEEETESSPRHLTFWKTSPAGPAVHEPVAATVAHTLQGVPLAEGVTVLLAAARTLDELDVEGLRAAAQPLVHWLRRRRLLPDSPNST